MSTDNTMKNPAARSESKSPSSVDEDSKVTPAKPKPKVVRVESLEQLLQAIYKREFKRPGVSKEELEAFSKSRNLNTETISALIDQARGDLTLSQTKALLLLALRLDNHYVNLAIHDIARQVIKQHPIYSLPTLEGIFDEGHTPTFVDTVINSVLRHDFAILPWPAPYKPLTIRQLVDCKANAIQCLLILFWPSRSISFDRILKHIVSGLWSNQAKRCKTEADRLHALISSKDPVAASLAYGILEKQSVEAILRADQAKEREESLRTQISNLQNIIGDLEKNLTAAHQESERVNRALHEAVQQHTNEKSHLVDDYVRLKGQVLHRLKEELILMDDGLEALRRDPPKVDVMLDHAERAISGLKKEMDKLRSNE